MQQEKFIGYAIALAGVSVTAITVLAVVFVRRRTLFSVAGHATPAKSSRHRTWASVFAASQLTFFTSLVIIQHTVIVSHTNHMLASYSPFAFSYHMCNTVLFVLLQPMAG